MPDIVKIGMTTRTVEIRLNELNNATGVAAPFIIAFSEEVTNAANAEKLTHAKLQKIGVRLSQNREFFKVPVNVAVKTIYEVLKENPELSNFDHSCHLTENIQEAPNSQIDTLLNEIEDSLVQANSNIFGSRNSYRDTLYDIAVDPPQKNEFRPDYTYETFFKTVEKAQRKLDLLVEKEVPQAAFISLPIKIYGQKYDELFELFTLVENGVLKKEFSQSNLVQIIAEHLLLTDEMLSNLQINNWVAKFPSTVCDWLSDRLNERVEAFINSENELLDDIFDKLISDDYFSIDMELLLNDLLKYRDLRLSYKSLTFIAENRKKDAVGEDFETILRRNSLCAGLVEALYNLRSALLEYDAIPKLNSVYKTDATLRTTEADFLEVEENIQLIAKPKKMVDISVSEILSKYKELWLLQGISGLLTN